MMKILIAEDKPESLALLDSFLKKMNYQTYCAPNGKVALEILEKNKVDLIISDILMPEVDGYIFCQKVKSDPRWSQIPFIFYTATFTSRQDEIFAIKLGADRFVRKPINPAEFAKIILDVLQKYKKGTLEPARYKFKEEKDVFRLYNLRVIEKLEQKVSELEESENRYRILFETAAEGILIIDSGSRQFKYANPAICLMLGYPEAELLKLGIEDIHPKDKLPEIRREFEALNHGQKSLAMDIPCQRKDGSILYANFSINQITMGGVKYSVAFVTDTTEYKKAMDALRSSEARLSTAMKIAKLGYWEIDNSDGLFTFDDNFYAIFHTTAAKEGGYKMSPKQYAKRFLHPDDQIMVAIEMQKSLQATDPHYHRQLEHRIIYADGGEGWIAVNFFIKKDDQGRTIGAFGVNQDITERKRMQEMIVQEQKELKLIIDTSPVIIFYKDKEGKFIRVNKAFADALRMNEADFIGKTVFDLYTKKIAQSMTDDDRKVFKSNRPKLNIIEQYQSASGLRWVQTDKIPIQDKNGNPIGLIGFTLDITERKQAEEALRKFENMLKLISENSRDIICLHDKNHKYLYVSPICKTLLGYKPEELIGTNPWELVHPEDLESLQKEGPVKAETEGISLLSYRIRKKSGKYIWFESASQTLRDDKGKITGYVTSSRDITKRKRVEEALIAERDKLQRVTDGLTAVEIGIDIVDINYQVLYQNLFLKNRFGDLTNKLCYEKYLNLKEPCPFCPMVKAIATNLPQKLELTGADGKIYELLSAPLPDPDGTVNKVIEIVRDITERKQAEEEYKQLINSMSETVWVINFEGKFVEVNDAAVKQLGYSREELLTMGPKDIDPNLSAIEIDQLIEGMKSDTIQNFETEHRTKAGKIIPVEINSTPVTYHGQGAILSIARDITERKQAEENIRRITESTHAILWHADVTKMKNESQGCRGFEWDTHYLNLENLSNFIPLKEAPDIDLGQRYHTSILEEDRLRMDEISAKAFKNNAESYEQEYRLQDADGTLHWMREHVDINKINASHYKVTGIIIEISELKRVQEALDLAVQSARVGLWNQDFRTGKITRNAEWANMLGYELSEIESDVNFFYQLIHPDDWQRVEKIFKDHESGKSKFLQTEHRMRTKDGNWKWILNMGRVIEWDATGKPLRAAGVHLDITERKQAEETLREGEERYRAVVENSHEGIIIVGEDYKFNYVNDTLCTMLGRQRKDIIGHDFREFLDEESKSLVADYYLRRQRGEKVPTRYEFNVVRKKGDKRRVEISSTVVRDAKGKARTIAQLLDITERKKAEEALRESESLFRKIFEKHSAVKLLIDPEDGQIVDANEAAVKFYGWSRKQLRRMKISNINTLPPAQVKAEMEKVRAKKRVYFEFKHRRADGSVRDVAVYSTKIESGGKDLLHSIIQDITERKQAEKALKESEEKYRMVMDQAADSIFIHDNTGRILDVNQKACQNLGYSRDELLSLSIIDIDPEAIKAGKDKIWGEILAGKQATFESHQVRKDSTDFPVEVTLGRVILPAGPVVLGIVRDITERKQAEAEKLALETQLLQSQKMEAVGNLAGGIAHDFNNLLTIIQGHAQLMMAAKNESDQEYYGLKQIVNAAFRAAQLTRQLLLFSRKQEMSFAILNPNRTIDNISKMLERLIGENIVIKLQLGDNLWNIEADEGNLEQVIMNLVVNARDAMPHGGTLTVKTENLELTEQDCALIPRSSPGKYICLTIQDTGCGIPPEVIDKIFDPFFTTKEAGKGTGLGLSVAYGIIKKHNGWINVKSELEKGTIFTICLPASQKSVLDDLTLKDQLAQKFGQDEPILVIEDDNDVRKFMVTILQHYHYVPLEAADAATATTIFQKEKEKIKLIIADVILPDRNGILLVEDFLATQAHIPVIMCSGYANEKVQHEIITKKKFHYLQKPIKAQTFLDLVHDTLASARK